MANKPQLAECQGAGLVTSPVLRRGLKVINMTEDTFGALIT